MSQREASTRLHSSLHERQHEEAVLRKHRAVSPTHVLMLTYGFAPLAINLVTEADQAAVSVMPKWKQWAGKYLEQTLIQSRSSAAQLHT